MDHFIDKQFPVTFHLHFDFVFAIVLQSGNKNDILKNITSVVKHLFCTDIPIKWASVTFYHYC